MQKAKNTIQKERHISQIGQLRSEHDKQVKAVDATLKRLMAEKVGAGGGRDRQDSVREVGGAAKKEKKRGTQTFTCGENSVKTSRDTQASVKEVGKKEKKKDRTQTFTCGEDSVETPALIPVPVSLSTHTHTTPSCMPTYTLRMYVCVY